MELCHSGRNFSFLNVTMEVLMGNKDNNFSNLFSCPVDGHLRNSETACRMPSASLFFNNLSKQNRKCEMSFSISNSMKKKVENFAKCNTSKENNFMKYTIDQWSSGCSEFFTSPKPYSYDSNSIASFLIGGFVGSKSQMNNEKHKLSYDLGEVILKIHNIKYKFEEKKYDVKSHRKHKTFKDMNCTYEDQYNIVLVEDSIDSLRNECKEKSNFENKKCDLTSNSVKVNLESFENEPINNFEPLCNNKVYTNDKLQPVAIKAINEKCHEKSIDFDETFEDKQNIFGSENNDLETVKDLTVGNCEEILKDDEQRGDTNSLQCLTSEKRRRQCSECSLESTDSESFIVFDDRCCESVCDELENTVLQETENDESDFYFEEDDCDNLLEDDGDSSWIRTDDECDTVPEDDEISEANTRWAEIYKDTTVEEDESRRKVKFNDNVDVHKIVAWDYAYRAARPGPWEQMARDRARFRERILRLASVLSPVLQERHREAVYNNRYLELLI